MARRNLDDQILLKILSKAFTQKRISFSEITKDGVIEITL